MGGLKDGKHHDSSSPFLASFTADHFDKNLSQPLKGEDVDDGLEHAVEEGEGEGPVEPLGRLRGGEGSTGKGEAERGDGDEEDSGDANHLDCHSFEPPESGFRFLKSTQSD